MKKIIILFVLAIIPYKVKASYVVLNQDNNKVIYSNNMHEKKLIASISKVMTAYIVIKYEPNLEKEITVGREVLDSHGSSIYLKVGEKLKVKDLLYGLLLRSGNDAALTLSVNTAGSVDKFVELMNKEAEDIGMNDTLFQNPTGLDDAGTKNISSAYDMAILTSRAMNNTVFREIFKTKKYKIKTNLNYHEWINKNKALFIEDFVTGGKTGFTKKARRTLITTASKEGVNLVIVSLNISDDFNYHINTYRNFFKTYKKYLLFNKYDINTDEKIISNKYLYAKENFYYLLKISNVKDIKIRYIIYKKKKYRNHEIVGKVEIYDKDELIFETPIYYLNLN